MAPPARHPTDHPTDPPTRPPNGVPMDPTPATVFRFTAEGIDLEFAGSEAFVEQQVQRFRAFLERAVSAAQAGTPAPAPAPAVPAPGAAGEAAPAPSETGAAGTAAPAAEKVALDVFYAQRPLREGRGAIQDRILLFIYYLQHVQGKREVSGDDILWCFQQLNLERPKNLHNALGILKRKLNHLEEGSRRGLYSLSPAGRGYVEGRFS